MPSDADADAKTPAKHLQVGQTHKHSAHTPSHKLYSNVEFETQAQVSQQPPTAVVRCQWPPGKGTLAGVTTVAWVTGCLRLLLLPGLLRPKTVSLDDWITSEPAKMVLGTCGGTAHNSRQQTPQDQMLSAKDHSRMSFHALVCVVSVHPSMLT
jgi:hypothetical protein